MTAAALDRPLSPDPEKLAAQLRELLGSGPLHLNLLARRLGVRAILNDPDLASDGLTAWTSEGPCISLRSGLASGRRRFALSHELTHVLLGHGHAGTPVRNGDACTDERLCDATAAALLMPPASMHDMLGRSVRLRTVLSRAQVLDVSISALVVRMNELSNKRHVFLRAIRQQGIAAWTVMPPLGLRELPPGNFTFGPSIEERVEGVSERPQPVRIVLYSDDGAALCLGDGSRLHSHFVGLFPADRLRVRRYGAGSGISIPANRAAASTSPSPGPES